MSYGEFCAQRYAEHVNPFNRWCAVIANYLPPLAVAAAVVGRWKVGASIFAVANAALIAGHLVEGNLRQELGAFVSHPLWAVRSDVAVANATVREALSGLAIVNRRGRVTQN